MTRNHDNISNDSYRTNIIVYTLNPSVADIEPSYHLTVECVQTRHLTSTLHRAERYVCIYGYGPNSHFKERFFFRRNCSNGTQKQLRSFKCHLDDDAKSCSSMTYSTVQYLEYMYSTVRTVCDYSTLYSTYTVHFPFTAASSS